MSKSITWGKMKELFKLCSDDTVVTFQFLKSFDDISNWFDEEVQKEKESYLARGYQKCLDDIIRKQYSFDEKDSCLTCSYGPPYGGCFLKEIKNKQIQIGEICPFFSNYSNSNIKPFP